jgi:hypothetical protein
MKGFQDDSRSPRIFFHMTNRLLMQQTFSGSTGALPNRIGVPELLSNSQKEAFVKAFWRHLIAKDAADAISIKGNHVAGLVEFLKCIVRHRQQYKRAKAQGVQVQRIRV